jgi:hypothetical protein
MTNVIIRMFFSFVKNLFSNFLHLLCILYRYFMAVHRVLNTDISAM